MNQAPLTTWLVEAALPPHPGFGLQRPPPTWCLVPRIWPSRIPRSITGGNSGIGPLMVSHSWRWKHRGTRSVTVSHQRRGSRPHRVGHHQTSCPTPGKTIHSTADIPWMAPPAHRLKQPGVVGPQPPRHNPSRKWTGARRYPRPDPGPSTVACGVAESDRWSTCPCRARTADGPSAPASSGCRPPYLRRRQRRPPSPAAPAGSADAVRPVTR